MVYYSKYIYNTQQQIHVTLEMYTANSMCSISVQGNLKVNIKLYASFVVFKQQYLHCMCM